MAKKKVIVISLGGSIIVPDEIDVKFLKKFKKILLKSSAKYKFIIVCGGGSLARKYASAIKNSKDYMKNMIGFYSTRLNARLVNAFINNNPNQDIPNSFPKLKASVKKHDITVCGALEFKLEETTDATGAKIAKMFNTSFINLTNIDGLYNKNPKKHKNARFISKITWEAFYSMANKIKFKPGQHFVLDQKSSEIIMKNKIPAYILGTDLKNLNKVLKGKKFKGTLIQG